MSARSARLHSIDFKIERAKKHISDLKVVTSAFCDANRDAVTIEDDPHTGDKSCRVRFRIKDIPSDVSLIIGDAVHNLRSSLDHLACRLVEANGKKPGSRTAFPICDTREAYEANGRRAINKVAPIVMTLIEAIQPYAGPSYGYLEILRQLDNIDKHRLLVVTTCRLAQMRVSGIAGVGGFTMRSHDALGTAVEIEDGYELCRMDPGDERNADVNLTIYIALGEPQIAKGESVVPYLAQLAKSVEGLVNQFVPFL